MPKPTPARTYREEIERKLYTARLYLEAYGHPRTQRDVVLMTRYLETEKEVKRQAAVVEAFKIILAKGVCHKRYGQGFSLKNVCTRPAGHPGFCGDNEVLAQLDGDNDE